MKKLVLSTLIFAVLITGCGIKFNKVRYQERRADYIQLRDMYIETRELVYGKNGDSEIWEFLQERYPELCEKLIEAHTKIIVFDKNIQSADKVINETLMKEQNDRIKITFGLLIEILKMYKQVR